jgi:hypothetical protein
LSKNAARKTEIPRKKFTILIILLSLAGVVANIVILSNQKLQVSFSFQEGSQVPIFDGRLVLNNDFTTDGSSHHFSIYGSNGLPGIEMRVSDLTERDSGNKIDAASIILSDISSPNIITPENPRTIGLSIDSNLTPGIYQGTLFVRDGTSIAAVAINLDVKPLSAKPILIVVDGITLSIVLWKVIAYLNSLYPEVEVTNEVVEEVINRKDRFSAIDRLDAIDRLGARALRHHEMRSKGPFAYATKKPVAYKNLILDIGTIIFGIGLGIIGLPTTETIINIHSIGGWQVLSLIGIGLGIGSLKEFISKS